MMERSTMMAAAMAGLIDGPGLEILEPAGGDRTIWRTVYRDLPRSRPLYAIKEFPGDKRSIAMAGRRANVRRMQRGH